MNTIYNYENNYLDLNQMNSDMRYYKTTINYQQITNTVKIVPYQNYEENQIKTSYYDQNINFYNTLQNQNQINETIIPRQENRINDFAKVTPLNDYPKYTNTSAIVKINQQNLKEYNPINNPIIEDYPKKIFMFPKKLI